MVGLGTPSNSYTCPTWRIGPCSGSSTSTITPSRASGSSSSASSGERIGCRPIFASAASATHSAHGRVATAAAVSTNASAWARTLDS